MQKVILVKQVIVLIMIILLLRIKEQLTASSPVTVALPSVVKRIVSLNWHDIILSFYLAVY